MVSVQLSAVCRPSRRGICPRAICSLLSLLMADRTGLIGILWLREYKRNMYKFRPSLICHSTAMSTHFMDPYGLLRQAHWGIYSFISVTFRFWKALLLMSLDIFYFLTHFSDSLSDFHRAVPHTGAPLIGQLSIAFLPGSFALSQ